MFKTDDLRKVLTPALVAAVLASPNAQSDDRPTMPEQLTAAGESQAARLTIGSGPPPTVDHVLKQTDVIVRGTAEPLGSILSDDRREIYTTYRISQPQILYIDSMTSASRPTVTPDVTVKVLGGAVTLDGLTYTFRFEALPPLDSGAEYDVSPENAGTRN